MGQGHIERPPKDPLVDPFRRQSRRKPGGQRPVPELGEAGLPLPEDKPHPAPEELGQAEKLQEEPLLVLDPFRLEEVKPGVEGPP
ncbi:hypothetical protein TthSNM76_04340 [Thermus thermophilus]|nr:hypothetical protein TthSNM76_04340 [Thermus thermophilus]